MDVELKRRLNEAIDQIRRVSTIEDMDLERMDPILKMMLVALLNEEQKIMDYVDSTAQRIVDRYCTDFIPWRQVGATPAIALLNPSFRKKDAGIISVSTGSVFTYKSSTSKTPLNYIPLFNTSLASFSDMYVLSCTRMTYGNKEQPIRMDRKNCVWVGLVMNTEVE